MRIEIFSLNAAVTGTGYGTTWSGEVDHRNFPSSDYASIGENQSAEDIDRKIEEEDEKTREAILHIVFRRFNVVDLGDREWLLAFGYKLPSLSVGDYVTLHMGSVGVYTYQVSVIGFKKITENYDMLLRANFDV